MNYFSLIIGTEVAECVVENDEGWVGWSVRTDLHFDNHFHPNLTISTDTMLRQL